MTLHSNIEYQCPFCRNRYIPFPAADECPKCGQLSPTVYANFVPWTVESANYNLERYGSFYPPAWAPLTMGDSYYFLSFQFLKYCSRQKNVPENSLHTIILTERDIHSLAEFFIKRTKMEKRQYMADHLRIYLEAVLLELNKKHGLGHRDFSTYKEK